MSFRSSECYVDQKAWGIRPTMYGNESFGKRLQLSTPDISPRRQQAVPITPSLRERITNVATKLIDSPAIALVPILGAVICSLYTESLQPRSVSLLNSIDLSSFVDPHIQRLNDDPRMRAPQIYIVNMQDRRAEAQDDQQKKAQRARILQQIQQAGQPLSVQNAGK